jgi:hypothetical protein
MKKVFCFMLAVLLFGQVGYCADKVTVSNATLASGSSTIAVASTATIYTKAFPTSLARYYGVWYIATSSGTVNLKIELEQSWTLPTTEGSADSNWVVIEDTGTLDSALADEVAHVDRIYPKPMPYSRFKITGGTGNDASTTILLKISSQY